MNKSFFSIFLTVVLLLFTANAVVYNEQGDFKVEIASQTQTVYNDNLNAEFVFKVENLNAEVQDFNIVLPDVKGWDISTKYEVFTLNPGESKEVKVTFVGNSEFDYSTNLVAPDVIKISQKEDYKGYFEFAVKVSGDSQDVSMRFQVEIEKKEIAPVSYTARFASEKLSPTVPLRYSVTAENLITPEEVEVSLELNGQVMSRFKETFSKDNNYKIFQIEIPSTIDPGVYETRLVIRVMKSDGKSASEWYEAKKLEVAPYEKVIATRNFENTLFGERYSINLTNIGNVKSEYTEEVETNLFTLIFLDESDKYTRTEDGIKFTVPLEKGESKVLWYSYNYMFVYLIFIIFAFIAAHIYHKKNSNPLKIDKRVYEVKKVEHEGIKSLRIKLDFENMKDEQIEDLKVIFKMPSYLNVKEGSFLLVEPNHVLKGRDLYKLVWDFKKFEKNDSRILGFTVVNQRGVLGDIVLPEIEFELKINGKTTKYYEELPIIRY